MKRFFITRSRREQVLVMLLVVMAGAIWLSSALGRIRSTASAWNSAHQDLKSQQLWLNRRSEIDARTEAAVKSLDPSKTLDPTRLVSQISALASAAGISPSTEPPRTTHANNLAVHTVQVTCRRAKLASVVKFYEGISTRAPYLVLEQCTVQAERGAADLVNASFVLSSVEVEKAPAQ